jgi:hypothetical protein
VYRRTRPSFAQRFLSTELARLEAAEGQTRTFATFGVEQPLTIPSAWHAPDGSRCTPVLLSGIQDGQLCIAGVALVSALEEPVTTLAGVTAALTDYLLKDGETTPALLGD